MSAGRQFVDSFGFSWEAFEIPGPASPTDHRGRDAWLYFLSRGTTRRLRAFPADWASLDWATLEDLCGAAEVVGTDSHSRPVRSLEAGRV